MIIMFIRKALSLVLAVSLLIPTSSFAAIGSSKNVTTKPLTSTISKINTKTPVTKKTVTKSVPLTSTSKNTKKVKALSNPLTVTYEELSLGTCYIGACFNGVIIAPGAKQVELLWMYDEGKDTPFDQWNVQPVTTTHIGYDPTIGAKGKSGFQFVTWIPSSMVLYGHFDKISYAAKIDGNVYPIQYIDRKF